MNSLPASLCEKLAQLMFVRIGSNLSPVRTVEQDAERIESLLADCPLGGLILFNGRRGETARTLARLQSHSRFPLLVGSDIERGVGQQLLGHVVFPHARAFGALGSNAKPAVEQFAALTAQAARANGIHIVFSPVADVNSDPRNPIIATRSFGESSDRVAELVAAFVESSQAGGLLAAAKHFPGHGNTHEDSHSVLPKVNSTREELAACELAPFEAAIDRNVALIMSAHVEYPQLDASGEPATLSAPILIDLLRNELGFTGAVVSDSMLMEGVKQRSDNEGDLAVKALNAGVDILLDVADPLGTLDAMEQAVESGRLTAERVEEAFHRVWRLKETVFEAAGAVALSAAEASTDVGEDAAAELAKTCASGAIEILNNADATLPLAPEKPLLTVLLKPFTTNLDQPEQPLAAALQERFEQVSYFELGPESDHETRSAILQLAETSPQILVAMIVKPAAWHRFGLNDEHEALARALLKHEQCVLASLGTREALEPFDQAAAQLCTFSDVPVSQQALAERLVAPAAAIG